MSELHNENSQHNNLSIHNIMLHWELDGSLKSRVCHWGCALHTVENVESLWHVETEAAKDFLIFFKNLIFFKTSELFRMRHHDPLQYYTSRLRVLPSTNLHNNFATIVMT